MELTIEQSCPSCGADLILREDDRLIDCRFCGVHAYRVDSSACRYLLPEASPQSITASQIFYAPYLRFRGTIFAVQHNRLSHRLVDTTRLAIAADPLALSLGLRPQAMAVRPVVAKTAGLFLQQTMPTREVFRHATRLADLLKKRSGGTTQHRAFIGETLSRIYQPFYLKGEMVHDAVDNRPVCPREALAGHLLKTCRSKVSWEPRFLNTICRSCGGLLGGERDSVVLQCRNCAAHWQEEGKAFVPVTWEVVSSRNPEVLHLPFWRIELVTAGHRLASFADYLRFTNQPVVATAIDQRRPLCFWIPAIKIQPKAFLQLAGQLTIAQGRLPAGKSGTPPTSSHPVTLPRLEGEQSVKTVLAATTLARAKSLPLLPEIDVRPIRVVLCYLPFRRQTHDLVEEYTGATVQTAAIRYGRSL